MGWTGRQCIGRTGYSMRDRVHTGREVAGDGTVWVQRAGVVCSVGLDFTEEQRRKNSCSSSCFWRREGDHTPPVLTVE